MGKISNLFTALVCVVSAATAAAKDTNDNECMLYLKDKVSAASKTFRGGSWIDDGLALEKGGWEPGMDVMAIKYCTNKNDRFGALQLVVGHDDHIIELGKHGKSGSNPDCFRWDLDEGDYIRFIQYTWDKLSGDVVSVVFQTYLEKTRVVGKGKGTKVNYEYSTFQPFIGFFSYEVNGKIKAFGSIEDDCHNTPTNLPFGMADMNSPSSDELYGKESTASITWENGKSGEAIVEEEKLIEEIERYERENDEQIEEMDEANRVANDNFVDVNVNVVVNPQDDKEAKVEPDNAQPSKPKPEAYTEPVKLLQKEMDVLRQEMIIKDTLLAQKATTDRVQENKSTLKDDDDVAWTFATVMTIFAIIMLLVVICLCVYIKNLKNQRRNANDARRHEKAAIESETESPQKKMPQVKSTVVGVHMKNGNTKTPSMIGLREFNDPYNVPESSISAAVEQPDPYQAQHNEFGETSNTHMFGTQTPVGTYATNNEKLRDADNVDEVNPQNVQLEFGSDVVQSTGNEESKSNRKTPAAGNNPFATESDAELGVSDRSEAGPGGLQDQFNAMSANPSARD